MNKTLFFTLLLIAIKPITAQVPDVMVKWGAPVTNDVDYIIGATDNNQFYTFYTDIKGFKALHPQYDINIFNTQSLSLKHHTSFKMFKYKDNWAWPDTSWILNNTLYMLFNAYDKEADKRYLLVRQVDEYGKISEVRELEAADAYHRNRGGFTEKLSIDSTKVLVYSDPGEGKKDNEQFDVSVYDNDFQLLWDKEVELPFTNKYFQIVDQVVTRAGDVFILGYAEPDKTKGESKERNSSNKDYKLFRIGKGEDLASYDLDLSDKYVSSGFLHDGFGDKGNQLVIGGFYSLKREGEIGGSFFITMDEKSMEINSSNTQDFSDQFMADLISERKVRKGKELSAFKFKNILPKANDDGAYVVAERDFVFVTTTYMSSGPGMAGSTVTHTNYVSGDIIILDINTDGIIKWTSFIPKTQGSTDDGGIFLSYLLLNDNDQLKFIYNDNKKNLDRPADHKSLKSVHNFKKSVARCATVHPDGKVTYSKLFSNKKNKAILMPKRSYQVNPHNVLLFASKGFWFFQKSYIGKMTLQ